MGTGWGQLCHRPQERLLIGYYVGQYHAVSGLLKQEVSRRRIDSMAVIFHSIHFMHEIIAILL